MKWRKGDLVYIPQAAMLLRLTDTGAVSQFAELDSPATLLVSNNSTGPHDGYVEVVYQGSKWLVTPRDVYPATQ
jgi:hypothetical protein